MAKRAQHLINYFTEFPDIIKDIKEKSLNDQVKALKPLIQSSDELFYRKEELQDEDSLSKLVYVFMDGSSSHRMCNYTEDWLNGFPVSYIGMGSLTRPLDHYTLDGDTVNYFFRDWLQAMRDKDYPVYISIYAMGMSDIEAKQLEADLINRTMKIQSYTTGISKYRNLNGTPIKLFNSRREVSNQKVYSTNGIRHKVIM